MIKALIYFIGFFLIGLHAQAQVPTAPTGLTATMISNSQINLDWLDNATTETGYRVERSTDGTNYSQIYDSLAADEIQYADSGLTANTLYYYRVYAYNGSGNSSYSNVASTTTYLATCDTNLSGKQVYYGAENMMYFCDGSEWFQMGTQEQVTTCSEPGKQRYDTGSTPRVMQFCNGTVWVNMKGQNFGTCTSGESGKQRYNANLMQFCDGSNWYVMGPSIARFSTAGNHTWTTPAAYTYIKISVWGGGGGGAGTLEGASGNGGNGGQSSFNSTIISNGGSGGSKTGTGGAGGTHSGGDAGLSITGTAGGNKNGKIGGKGGTTLGSGYGGPGGAKNGGSCGTTGPDGCPGSQPGGGGGGAYEKQAGTKTAGGGGGASAKAVKVYTNELSTNTGYNLTVGSGGTAGLGGNGSNNGGAGGVGQVVIIYY